jgi:hypothetical protein
MVKPVVVKECGERDTVEGLSSKTPFVIVG